MTGEESVHGRCTSTQPYYILVKYQKWKKKNKIKKERSTLVTVQVLSAVHSSVFQLCLFIHCRVTFPRISSHITCLFYFILHSPSSSFRYFFYFFIRSLHIPTSAQYSLQVCDITESLFSSMYVSTYFFYLYFFYTRWYTFSHSILTSIYIYFHTSAYVHR